MDDHRIVELYWERSEAAIKETQKKYGKYCRYIARNILRSEPDAEECENDTYLHAWRAMPPHKPSVLSTFLGKITRRLALDRYAYAHAEKRLCTASLVLEELSECIPDATGDPADEMVLREALNGFLASLPERERIIFMRRYWYVSPVRDIARDLGLGVNNVKVILMRTRNLFKEYLAKEGIVI